MRRYTLKPSGVTITPSFSYESNRRKAVNMLSGLSLGILADGETNSREARFLSEWIRANAHFLPSSIVSKILPLLEPFSNGLDVSENTIGDLTSILSRIVAIEMQGPARAKPINAHSPCDLVFDDAEDGKLLISGHHVVISGKFSLGDKGAIFEAIKRHGGLPNDNPPTRTTSFLVVGSLGSPDYETIGIGSKIRKAIELKQSGQNIAILREADFFKILGPPSGEAALSSCSESDLPKPAEADLSEMPLAGKTFVITGTLSMDRDAMKRYLESKGAKVSGSVSANTDYLLSGEGGGSKRDKAEKLGVMVIGEEDVAKLIG